MNFEIREPRSDNEWRAYYHLRWQLLRQPWEQAEGSEKDEWEENAFHRIVVVNNNILAIGRIHFVDNHTAQIRYMAVSPQYERQGIATKVLASLEQVAVDNNISNIILHAREAAVGFYEKQGYTIREPSHILYSKIQHYLMQK